MSERVITNNRVVLVGEVTSLPEFSHEIFGEKFYVFELSVPRMSGIMDTIPVTVSDRSYYIEDIQIGEAFKIMGTFRSYNEHKGKQTRLKLSVFAQEIYEMNPDEDYTGKSFIKLEGYICKEPVHRNTPKGREIADMLVAVNRPYGKSDYIPCIVWGRNARYAAGALVGAKVTIEGRIQSREYIKQISETEQETRVAYEVSASKIVLPE